MEENIKEIPKEDLKIVMEETGTYHLLVLGYLLDKGYFVVAENALKIKKYLDCGLRKAKTIKNWLPYIVNSFIDERFSNGFTEGLNNKIKVIKRVGFGYRYFDFFRLRIMYILNGKISGISKKYRNEEK